MKSSKVHLFVPVVTAVLLALLPAPTVARAAAWSVVQSPNAGAYGLGASPFAFHAHPAPAEVAFGGTRLDVLRARQPVRQ